MPEAQLLDHAVIDEAQDFSPFQIELVRQLTRDSSVTILGDLAQGIYEGAGMANWEQVLALFPPGKVAIHRLERSYRSTHEIITFANQVLRAAGQEEGLARPIFRSGDPVRLGRRDGPFLPAAVVGEVRRLLHRRRASIAVVGRTDAQCSALHRHLLAAGLNPRRITARDRGYRGGLSVLPAYLVKGLEFDAVVVADAGAWAYGARVRDARLLYVVLTRALHELTVFYTDPISPLLAALPAELYQAL
jgi:DNA helicase-2/ATP-dependent DNA helicase PcrA